MADTETIVPIGQESIPLSRAVLCLDCEQIYHITDQQCPRCASASFAALQRFLRVADDTSPCKRWCDEIWQDYQALS